MQVHELVIQDNESISFIGDLHADSSIPASRLDEFLDTVVAKLEDILQKCIKNKVRAVFFSGDIYNRIGVTNECINKIGGIFLKFKNSGIEVLAIMGNHDLPRNDLGKTMEKSPLSILYNFGIIQHIHSNRRVVINKRTLITPIDFQESPVPALPQAKFNILFAHMYYEASDLIADAKHNIRYENLKDWNYNAMFLGHDHAQYDISTVDKTDIIRPGAVTRLTQHISNFEYQPAFYLLHKPWDYKKENWEKIDIACKPFKDIVSAMVLNRKFSGSFDNIKDLMSNLVSQITGVDNSKFDGILDRVKKDSNLSQEVRTLLLEYFVKEGIVV